MFLLISALQAIQRALQVLDVKPPGLPPGHRHWVEAQAHLANASREVERAIELWFAGQRTTSDTPTTRALWRAGTRASGWRPAVARAHPD